MSSYELTLGSERPTRNAVTGRFMKGHVPANKGKKWDDFMPKRAQKRCAKGWKNLESHRHHRWDNSGRQPKPVIAIYENKLLYFGSIHAAGEWCHALCENVQRCCALNSHPTGRGKAAQNTDHRCKGVRFYYESDHAIWSSKIK